MHIPRFIAALSASAMAHRHLLGVLLAAVACGGRSTDDLLASAGGSAAGGAGQGGGAGAAGGANAGSGAGGQGGTNWTACGPTTTCVLEAVSCCGPGCEPVPLSAFTAINQASVADYQKSHPVCRCAYPVCQSVPSEQLNVASYMATCEQGQCKAIDIRTSALTACTSSADCYLRAGTSCCAGCADLVAFSRKADVQNAVCPSGPVACPALGCMPAVPVGISAVCNQSGHCVVNYPLFVVDGGGTTPTPGNEGDDCATVPCALPLVCCPATNTCTPNDFKICPSSVNVACTKSSDCPVGQTCWVLPASSMGSGPTGSACAATAPPGAQGVACNHGPLGAGIADCPLPSSQWSTCFPFSNTPAGLGVCIN